MAASGTQQKRKADEDLSGKEEPLKKAKQNGGKPQLRATPARTKLTATMQAEEKQKERPPATLSPNSKKELLGGMQDFFGDMSERLANKMSCEFRASFGGINKRVKENADNIENIRSDIEDMRKTNGDTQQSIL